MESSTRRLVNVRELKMKKIIEFSTANYRRLKNRSNCRGEIVLKSLLVVGKITEERNSVLDESCLKYWWYDND